MSTDIRGIGVSAGAVVGPIVRVTPRTPVAMDEPAPAGPNQAAADADQAAADAAHALEVVAAELDRRAGLVSGDAAAVLAATAMMARDPALFNAIKAKLADGCGIVTAVDRSFRDFADQFAAVGGYLAERGADLLDVRDRTIARLLGRPEPGMPTLTTPSVIVALDLAPAETALLDPSLVLALVTEAGGRTSHTAILAAQLGIPAVVHAKGVLEIPDGTVVAVDGTSGEVLINPSDEVYAEFHARSARRSSLLRRVVSGPGRLADGRGVALYANIGTSADAASAAATDVEGVGLFRTEFLFMDRAAAPSLDEQVHAYATVFNAFGSRPVTIRTLDAGADKPLAFASQEQEPNPALGVRGLRLSQRRTDLLDTQLRAIAIAAENAAANVRVMTPMVATHEEAAWFADRCRDAGLDTVGVMVEVPSAALHAEHVLAPVDFASIGTNDLTQYTMAADRLSGDLAELLDPWQPAVLALIAATCIGATMSSRERAPSKPVGVCGEAAGDPLLALVLVGLGVTSLSMAMAKVPGVRLALSLHDYQTCLEMATAARRSPDAESARRAALALAHPDVRLIL